MIDKILKIHEENAKENQELVNTNGRSLDSALITDKDAREYTKKVYKKSFDKKRLIDLKNERYPDNKKWYNVWFINII